MAMTAAELVAYLRLDSRGFTKDMQAAERTMRSSDGKFRDWAKGMGQTAAETVTGGAAATTALATSVFKTGAEYNTLQQSSRAALKTIMGGGEQANKQMDKLDAFAKNSPFSKATFIKAQQQLLGFGMTAKDVVPTLDAIQNAVAATGGSNEDIAEISTVLAQVTGTGKITAETLNQLGYRGINAADIIGKEMGKSGNQIRESITKGTLDADKAMSALTTGMTKRFGGAAAGVKETMTGAADRVKAAFRDVGSHLAAPFVDPKGGGMAVTWFNQFADVVRAVEKKVKPTVDMLMGRFNPAFQKVSAVLLDAKDAVNAFDLRDLDKALDKVGQYAPAIAAVSGALFTLGTKNIPVIGGLASALGPIPAALAAASAASPEMRAALGDLMEALKPLIPVLVDLAEDSMGVFTTAVEGAAGILEAIVGVVGPTVEAFNGLPDPVKKTTLAILGFVAVQKLFPGFTTAFGRMGSGVLGHLKGMGDKIGAVPGAFRDWKGAVSGATGSLGDFRSATSLTVGAIGNGARKGLMGAVGGLTSFLGGPWGIALMAAGTALTLWAKQQQEAKQRVQEITDSLDEQTGAITEQTRSVTAKHIADAIGADNMKEWGVSAVDATLAAEGNADAMERVMKATEGQGSAVGFWTGMWNGATNQQDKNVTVQTKVREAIEATGAEIKKGKEDKQAFIDADKAAADATSEAERAQIKFKEALIAAGDATKTAEDRANSLKTALDILKGGTVPVEEAQRGAAASARSLAGFFREGKAESNNFLNGLINLKDGTIAQSDAGDRLTGLLDTQRTKMLQATQAAYDNAGGNKNAAEATAAAKAEYNRQSAALQKVYKKAGLSKEQIDALNKKYLDTPESVITNIALSGKGEFEDDVDYLTRTRQILFQATLKPGSFMADVQGLINQSTGAVKRAEKGRGWGVFKPGYGGTPNYFGGIDVKGMAAGGVTGSSMSVAQMVKPGDIRFAGDRSDVDEAWIPLDGSKRSWKILSEALKRMPGQGMAAGGVTTGGKTAGKGVAATVTPPKVDGVEAPDTALLTDTWQDAMLRMLTSTETAFQNIQDDTATGTTAATTATQTAGNAQVKSTKTSQASQTATTKAHNQARVKSTKTATGQEAAATRTAMTTMDRQVGSSLSHMRSVNSTMWATMAATTRKSSEGMRAKATGQFSAMARELESTRSGPLASTFSALSETLRDRMPAAFRAGKESSATAFAGLGPAAKDPVSYIVNTVYNSGIRGVWNKVANEFDKKNTLPEYHPSGFYTGGYTGDGGKYQKAGDVHAGEYVFRQEATRKLRKTYGLSGLDHMNRTGELPGYSDGGFVRPVRGGSFSSPFGVARAGGKHMGQDIALGAGNPIVAALSGVVKAAGWNAVPGRSGIGALLGHAKNQNTYYGHMSKIFVDKGDKVKAGQRIGLVGSTGNSTGPHLHFEFWNGNSNWKSPINPASLLRGGKLPKGGAAGGYDLGDLFVDPETYTKPLEALKEKLAGAGAGPWATMAQGVGKKMIDTMTGWITDNIDSAGGAGGSMGSPDGAGVSRWRGQVKKALAANGLPTTGPYVNAWMRQIKTESGGNPRAVGGTDGLADGRATGLLQTKPGTFRAHAFPGHKDIFNGYDNMLAAMRYAKGRYPNMLSVIGHGHGYKSGTSNAAPGYHWVGEQGPELMRFKGGETIRNNNRSRTIAATQSKLTRGDAKLIARELASAIPAGGDRYTINAQRDSGATEIADAIRFRTLQTRRR
ncbi:peptidoglycan DD-metalloendopeptidase family protein [Galactobacter sp.]|uniref:peptidoglycan DD-metalloendopeptidase family protein n=1 Tax=Galactobacter sp. TaxID=2676125 RepID=UPI0025BC258E|nr:peptidoglycan DD-metalloendopeptidase family protein [Galactobacter sp.]